MNIKKNKKQLLGRFFYHLGMNIYNYWTYKSFNEHSLRAEIRAHADIFGKLEYDDIEKFRIRLQRNYRRADVARISVGITMLLPAMAAAMAGHLHIAIPLGAVVMHNFCGSLFMQDFSLMKARVKQIIKQEQKRLNNRAVQMLSYDGKP